MLLNNHKNLKSELGFTLIELLVVIVIIGILATLTTITVTGVRANARDAKRVSDVKQIQSALELYHADHNTFPPPSAVTANQALVNVANNKTYMVKVPADPSTNQSYGYLPMGYNNYNLVYNLEKKVADLNSGTVTVSVQGAQSMEGLLAWWPLNGNALARDMSGNGYHATLSGVSVPVLTTGRFGEVDGAYNLSGANYIDTNLIKNIAVADFTISAWFKGSNSRYLVTQKNGVDVYASNFIVGGAGADIFWFRSVVLGTVLGGEKVVLTNGNWHHIVMRWDVDARRYRGFVDGSVIALSDPVGAVTETNLSIKIGVKGDASESFTVGNVTDVRIYERELSDDEIRSLANEGR